MISVQEVIMEQLKILVVDDEARMRKLVKDFLSVKGFSVLEASNGEEAVDLFFEQKDIDVYKRQVYERTFQVPGTWKGRNVLLNFGAVDYFCRVWVNGQCVGSHIGGQTPFSFDVTRCLNWGDECIRVEVEDWLKDEQIARGKQYWEDESSFIWYTPSTGIWQTVWLEPVSASRFSWIRFTPDIDEGTVKRCV